MRRRVEQSLRSKDAPAALAATPKTTDPVTLATATSTAAKDEREHLHQKSTRKVPEVRKSDKDCSILLEHARRLFENPNLKLLTRFAGDDESAITLNVWDFGGQKVFDAMHSVFLNQLGVYIVVFSIPNLLKPQTKDQTLQTMGHWLNSIAFQAPDAPFLLVGTHKDELESADTQLAQAQRLVHAYIKDMYIAGKDGIIKNIRKPPNAGPTSLWFFAVDSKSRKAFDGKVSDPVIIQLRDALQQAVALDKRLVTGLDGVDTPYLDFRMPTSALMLLRVLKLGVNTESSGDSRPQRRVCSYADFKGAAKELGMDHRDESIEHLLQIFSGLGALNWFPKVTKDLVVLDPQWLLDSISCLIREHHGKHSDLLKTLEDDVHALPFLQKGDLENGIVSVELLDYIWSSHKAEYKALGGQPMELAALKKILEHFGLICRVQLPQEAAIGGDEDKASCEYYIVPPLLPDSMPTDSHISEYLEYPNAKKFTCLCDFSKSKWLQRSLFQRLVCSIVLSLRGVLPVTHLMVTQRAAYMYAGDAVLSLRLIAERWQIEAQTVNYDGCPHSSRWMLRLVLANMKRVLQVFPKQIPYEVFLRASENLLVKLSDLKKASTMVSVVPVANDAAAPRAPKRVQAKLLKENWLRDPRDCELNCCWKSASDPSVDVQLHYGQSRPKLGAYVTEIQQRLIADGDHAKRIVALVVGNDDYRFYQPLKHGVKDARAFGTKLESQGARVVYALNCTASKFNAKVEEYLGVLQENDVGMFYFAGHGCEYHNAIRAFGISEGAQSDIKTDSVNVLVLINKMRAKKTRANIAILDCCRSFRYSATRPTRGTASRTTNDQPLPTFLQATTEHSSVLIALACAPNHAASDDGGEGHGLFTQYLLKYLTQPNLDIRELFDLVKKAVLQKSNGEQEPFIISSFFKKFYLFTKMLKKLSANAVIDVPTAAPQIHSQVVAASAAESTSMPTVESNHPVYVWLAELKMQQYFNRFLDDGYDEVETIKCMSREDLLAIEGMKKGHALKISKAIAKQL